MDLSVHYEDRLVATISADAQTTRPIYADIWGSTADSLPVSLTMPIRPEPCKRDEVLSWPLNLLPKGKPLLAITGARSIAPQRSGGETDYRTSADTDALERIIKEMPTHPFPMGENGVSMAFAGA